MGSLKELRNRFKQSDKLAVNRMEWLMQQATERTLSADESIELQKFLDPLTKTRPWTESMNVTLLGGSKLQPGKPTGTKKGAS